MKKTVIISLLALISLWGCGQIPLMLTGDTASSYLPEPPDTAQSFSVNMANPGDASGLAEGVQAYYSFEETSGVTCYDSAGSYDGTMVNTPTLQQTGKSNYCYSYDDASLEWINFGTSFYDVGTNDLSVSVWVYHTGNQAYGGIMGCYGSSPYWDFRVGADGSVKCFVNFGSSIEVNSWPTQMAINTWCHLVFRLDRDGDMTLHINNVLCSDQEDISAHSATNLSNSNTFAIGRIGNDAGANFYHDGLLDEIAIYNRLLPAEEISDLFNQSVGKFWPFGVAGGDSLRMRNIDFDERADTFRVNYKVGAWPETRISDSVVFAFGIADTADYNDTTFLYRGKEDTTAYFTEWSGITATDTWTAVPNKDTVFVDSSNKVPPVQDEGIWDIIMEHDFEERVAPAYWDLNTFKLDIPNSVGRYGNQWYRAEELRTPSWWDINVDDSIVVDVETGSKVLKTMWRSGTHDGYVGNSFRGGEYWKEGFPGSQKYKELYASINVKLGEDFFESVDCGGKIFPGFNGGSPGWTVTDPPDYGEGFWFATSWGHEEWLDQEGCLFFYIYYQQNQTPYGASLPWDTFQPTGGGIDAGDYNAAGKWLYPDDSEEWVNITVRCVVNSFTGSTPNYDGILEGYINGRLVARYSNLYLITYPDEVGGNYIDYHQFYQSWGGSCGPDVDKWAFSDDIVIWVYDEEVDVPRGNEPSPPGRVLNLPNWPKED